MQKVEHVLKIRDEIYDGYKTYSEQKHYYQNSMGRKPFNNVLIQHIHENTPAMPVLVQSHCYLLHNKPAFKL